MDSQDFSASNLQGALVDPKKDCPHIKTEFVASLFQFFKQNKLTLVQSKCADCQNKGENWISFEQARVGCSRYVSGHMAAYMQNIPSEIRVAFSLADGSIWCYDCESYITNKDLEGLRLLYGSIKFPDEVDSVLASQLDKISFGDNQERPSSPLPLQKEEEEEQKSEGAGPKTSGQGTFSIDQLVDGIKQQTFKKILFLTGAGISVAAGIPDFRTPGTGLYSQLQKYNLPYPEAIFQLDYYQKNPLPFNLLSQFLLDVQVKPVTSHYFINEINQLGTLLHCFTQNIDGLQLEAGLPLDKLLQAHGHYRTAHCITCRYENQIEDVQQKIFEDQIPKCIACSNGLVKPDIVFFGESLPHEFGEKARLVKEADLVFVMGTSLKVFPFAGLVHLLDPDVPVVLVNRENPGVKADKFLFLEGDIDTNIEMLSAKLDFVIPKIEKKQVQQGEFKNVDSK